MAMYRLMHATQGTKSLTQFAQEVEELATQCQFEDKPYNRDRAMKDAIIFGTSDDKLRQEALAKDYKYADVMKAGLGYEQARKASGVIRTEEVTRFTQEIAKDDLIAKFSLPGKYSARATKSKERPKTKREHMPKMSTTLQTTRTKRLPS